MKKYKSIINIVVVSIVLSIMYYNLVPSREEANCILYNEFKNLVFEGVVINRYYDKTQHSYPTVEIRALDSSRIWKINLIGEKSKLFNLFQISDTIMKERQSGIIMRKRNGTYSESFKADFDCKDSNRN